MGIESAMPGRAVRIPKDKSIRWEDVVKGFGVYIFSAVLIAMSLFFFLWTRVSVVTINYEINELSAKRDTQLKENRELTIQFETVVTPKNLEWMGKKLGLKYPKRSQTVPVRENDKNREK